MYIFKGPLAKPDTDITATVDNKKSITVVLNYRPPNRNDEIYLTSSKVVITFLKGKRPINVFLLGRDFNLSDLNWETLQTEGSQYPSQLSQTVFELISDNSLEQVINFPTRRDETLDLILISHSTSFY